MKKIISLLLLLSLLLVPVFSYAEEIENVIWEDQADQQEEILIEEELFSEDEIQLEDGVQLKEEVQTEEVQLGEEQFSENEVKLEEEMNLEEFPLTVFSEENVDLLEAKTEAAEEVIEEIEDGNLIALAAADLASDEYRVLVSSGTLYCDEVWDASMSIATRYRRIEYVNSLGEVKRSPLYCLNSSKLGIDPENSGDYLKEAAISFLSNSTIKKLLYFGYGGPGDICDSYDPTCSHVDWSNWHNRYIFTHQALSKEYANDVGGATEEQIKHVGLNKFITKIKSLTIPNRKAVKIKGRNAAGNIVTTNSLSVRLSLYRKRPEGLFEWVGSSYKNGFQATPVLTVIDNADTDNGIKVTRETTDIWQLAYWKSAEEAVKNPNTPSILAKGKSVSLKDGYQFQIVFPKDLSTTEKWSYPMTYLPVKYVLVDGDIQQNGSGHQDFGAFVYQGERGSVTINFVPQKTGNITLFKKCQMSGEPLKGAEYGLYAAEDLYSGYEQICQTDELVEIGITDVDGKIQFQNLLPGKYYVKELTAPPLYLRDEEIYEITAASGKTRQLKLSDIPDIKGKVAIEKMERHTNISLIGAEFFVYSWNENEQRYENGVPLVYDAETKRYVSDYLQYDKKNHGKFQVRETRNPNGYTGNWMQEFQLTQPGEEEYFEFQVYNDPLTEKIIEIRKQDSQTKVNLTGAEFILYEWNTEFQDYYGDGELLTYDGTQEKYVSKALEITEENQGLYKIVETKNPEGYMGTWEWEVDLKAEDQTLQFTVENDPVPKKYGKIELKKTDAITCEVLEDAVFQIYQWNNVLQAFVEIPENGGVMFFDSKTDKYHSEKLELTDENEGRFSVKEVLPPEGYEGIWEREVLLSEDGAVISLEVVNEPVQLPCGEIIITKKIKEEDIIWAHGNPTFPIVVMGHDLRGNPRKYENYISFVKGGYTVDESGYATLELIFPDVPIGTYQIFEKPVLRYYLESAAGQTNNVYVQCNVTPSYGVKPDDSFKVRAELSMDALKASVLFVNEKSRYDGYSHNCVMTNQIPIIF